MNYIERQEYLAEVMGLIEQFCEYRNGEIESGRHAKSREYVVSFGHWRDCPYELVKEARLEPEVRKKLLALTEKELKTTLENYSYFLVGDPYPESGEVFSLSLGEVEEQLPNELARAFANLRELEQDTDYQISGNFIYLNHDYTRYLMVFDEERYLEESNPEAKIEAKAKTSFGKLQSLKGKAVRHSDASPLKAIGGAGFTWLDRVNYRVKGVVNLSSSKVGLKLVD